MGNKTSKAKFKESVVLSSKKFNSKIMSSNSFEQDI